jgi:hypothetical protein
MYTLRQVSVIGIFTLSLKRILSNQHELPADYRGGTDVSERDESEELDVVTQVG